VSDISAGRGPDTGEFIALDVVQDAQKIEIERLSRLLDATKAELHHQRNLYHTRFHAGPLGVCKRSSCRRARDILNGRI